MTAKTLARIQARRIAAGLGRHGERNRPDEKKPGSERSPVSINAAGIRAAGGSYEPLSMCSVTRRLASCPSFVELSARGSSLPKPLALI
jgi:hypothetical protein